jgi:hypothetical protein
MERPQIVVPPLLLSRLPPAVEPRASPRQQLTPRDGPLGCMLGPRHDLFESNASSANALASGRRSSAPGASSQQPQALWASAPSPRSAGIRKRSSRRLARGLAEELYPRAIKQTTAQIVGGTLSAGS